MGAHTPVWQTHLYEKTRKRAIRLGEELLAALSQKNLRQGTREDLSRILQLLPFYIDVVATANGALAKAPPAPAQREPEPAMSEFVVSSMFLAICSAYLTSDPHLFERLFLVTGKKHSPHRRSLDYMSKVALAGQSEIAAVADQESLCEALTEFDSWGHVLQGLFHSHPGRGEFSTRPSSTDHATHERYERWYPLVGCIFVKDGYLRFFRHTTEPFTITILGTGIVPINEVDHVFKIQDPTRPPRFVSYETFETGAHG